MLAFYVGSFIGSYLTATRSQRNTGGHIPMQWEFYLDESGNAGDINPKVFNGKLKIEQPVFAIAGIGYPSDCKGELDYYVQYIRRKYNVPNSELKAKSLYRSNPDVFVDIVSFLKQNRFPVFVELNDKRYFIACKIIELIFKNAREIGTHPQVIYDLTRYYSDFICKELDDNLLAEFAQVSIKRSPHMLNQWLDKILCFLGKHDSIEADILYGNLKSVAKSYKDDAQQIPIAHEQYLPEPDKNQRGEIIALLPHIPALISVLQRIIKFTTDIGVTDLRIIHDEQRQFEHILLESINTMQDPEIKKMIALCAVDEITATRSLTIPDDIKVDFGVSRDEIGIQIADLLAGTLMRIWRELLTENVSAGSKYANILKNDLIPFELIHPSFGINFVVPNYDLNSFLKCIGS